MVSEDFLRNSDLEVQTQARVGRSRGMKFIAIAVLNDLHRSAVRKFLSIGFAPASGFFLSRNPNLWFVGGVHGNVAAAISNRDPRVCGNRLRCYFQVELIDNSPLPASRRQSHAPGVIDAHHDAQKREQSEDQKNLAGSNARGAGITRAAGTGALVSLIRPQKIKISGHQCVMRWPMS